MVRVTDPITRGVIAAIVLISLIAFAFMMERIFKMYGLYFAIVVVLVVAWLLYKFLFISGTVEKVPEPQGEARVGP
jgi:xanthine/uracil permease